MQKTLFLLGLLLSGMTSAHAKQLAIIIDDVGYRPTDKAVLELPNAVTLSVFAFSTFGPKLAQQGAQKGHEIMIHQPMQALNGKNLGDGGLTNNMSEQQVKSVITEAIRRVPQARGMNNHMGSLLTQLPEQMNWVMQTLKGYNYYFVDSSTTRYTVAQKTAQQNYLANAERHIFLDNDLQYESLQRQFGKMIDMVNKQGQVIAIAHPHPETMTFLKQQLPLLNQYGIQLLPASQLIPRY